MSEFLDPHRPELAAAYLRERLARADVKVPPYPAVATELQRLAADPAAGVKALAAVVGRDVAVAAAVVRHASTAAMGRSAVLTLEQAVWKVGAAELARLALALTIGAAAVQRGALAGLRRVRWRHAITAAVVAHELAPRRGHHADQAFLAGLIHDLGAVVALAALEEHLAPDAGAAIDVAAWDAVIEDVHVEVGLVIADRWQLPEVLREIIAYHHAPEACLRQYRPQVTLIQQIDYINATLESPVGTEGLRDVPGLDHDERFRIVALLPRVAEIMATFALALPPLVTPPVAAPAGAPTWPVDFAVEVGRDRRPGQARWMSAGQLGLVAPTPLPVNWLASVVIAAGVIRCELMANVVACAPGAGGHHVVLTPFALDGPVKRAWLDLLTRARAGVAAAS